MSTDKLRSAMKIIDPDSGPRDFGPVAFEPAHDDTSGEETFAVMAGGARVGTMAPLHLADDEVVLLGDGDCYAVHGHGYWSLEIAGTGDDDPQIYFLWTADEEESPSLTGELAVWATLTVTRSLAGRPFGRG